MSRFTSSKRAALSEAGTEYEVGCVKHIYPAHILLQFSINNTLEDQYLWRDRRGHFHALTHKNPAGGVSSHLWSADGVTWRTSPVAPYTNIIPLDDGTNYTCGKRARPMLLVEGGGPRYLSTGASYAKAEGGGDHTFTTMQAVRGDRFATPHLMDHTR